ncbi:DUF4365 domain-containing protein [Mucilaginibacter terrigena]|uniref:DUF4365 domain-containing protein n=1 Tax=Mucilaginibacter terrigena TaxID=2492395 RepID=A0A4Q5LPL4_9SPHI|nr:DUF4365 domain-containing protein [Mucilaginibacter terrigena]RYU91344.1 DUF4365 domain-containing protein [Mucilaginibacter terrigena]
MKNYIRYTIFSRHHINNYDQLWYKLNAVPTQNEIGELGESIFQVAISRDYIFYPVMLGEKWPSSDFYVELRDGTDTMFFIVQVKSTIQGVDKYGFLPAQATLPKLRELNKYCCPTYVAAVDINKEEVYMVAVNGTVSARISKFPTTFKLDAANRQKLYKDVETFWKGSGIKAYKNSFTHSI